MRRLGATDNPEGQVPLGWRALHWSQYLVRGCGKTPVSYQGIALAIPQVEAISGRQPAGLIPSLERPRLHTLPKSSTLHLILGGAAVHRCDNWSIFIAALAAEGRGPSENYVRARMGRAAKTRALKRIPMKIGVLFFGVLKDLVGRSGETIDLPEGAKVQEVLSHYGSEAPQFEAMVPSLAIAVNREYSGPERTLREGDEVGLLPPVSGGSAETNAVRDEVRRDEVRNEVRIVREPIDRESVVKRLKRPEDGAVVIFDGVVRNHTRGRHTLYLDYEAYETMALKQMESLAREARPRFEVRGASIVHRLGRLEIGETSVLIVVAAAHRGAAFEACRWIIDTLKKTVPIWKKEYFEDGAVWADGEAFPEEIRRPAGTAGKPGASK